MFQILPFNFKKVLDLVLILALVIGACFILQTVMEP